jgi:hypothetical protein
MMGDVTASIEAGVVRPSRSVTYHRDSGLIPFSGYLSNERETLQPEWATANSVVMSVPSPLQ